MYFEPPRTWIVYDTPDYPKAFVLGLTTSVLLGFCIYPGPLFALSQNLALSLCI